MRPTRSPTPNQPGPGGSYDKDYKKAQANNYRPNGQNGQSSASQPSDSNEQNFIFG